MAVTSGRGPCQWGRPAGDRIAAAASGGIEPPLGGLGHDGGSDARSDAAVHGGRCPPSPVRGTGDSPRDI
jgi:hypothetical protein